ncbi:MAG TPA: colicin immunity protein [Devosia sp.]|nr:colicin immunity protein [Devosia sp.]
MYLTADAALGVCAAAATRGLLIYRIEGGIWHEGRGCEMRLGAIWDSRVEPPVDVTEANASNLRLASLIRDEPENCDTFVLSMIAIEGRLGQFDA